MQRGVGMANNRLTSATVWALSLVIHAESQLETLSLGDNDFSDGGDALALLLSQSPSKLRAVAVPGCRLSDDDGISIAKAIQDASEASPLERLQLNRNELGDVAAIELGTAIAGHPRITHFSLADNRLGTRGALGIAAAVNAVHRVQTADLSGNPGIAQEQLELVTRIIERNVETTKLV